MTVLVFCFLSIKGLFSKQIFIGQKMTWSNWERGQGPVNGGFLFSGGQFEDCAMIRKDDGYKWHDYACNLPSNHYGSICEYSKYELLFIKLFQYIFFVAWINYLYIYKINLRSG